MPMTASDILHNADAYRAAYPEFGRPAEPAEPEWVHGTHLGRDHRSVRQHLAEDHGTDPGWLECASDGAVHGRHDGLHGRTWAYAEDLPHPEAEVRERQQRIRAILSGQSVPRLPGPVPVAVCEPDERTDELAAMERADYDAGEGLR